MGRYLVDERGDTSGAWAWVGRRRGAGRPLRYDAFAAMLTAVSRRAGVENVHAHMFRHGLAEAVTAASGLQVAQQILGHQQLGTTAAFYARVDEAAMVTGVEQAARRSAAVVPPSLTKWVFDYDDLTLEELDRLIGGNDGVPGR